MSAKDYNVLREHYQSIFELFDQIHFNSSVTESVYIEHLNIKNSDVIYITHSNIDDNRVLRSFESKRLNLIFIGNTSHYKGFPMLNEVLMELYSDGVRNWQLDIWGAIGTSECELIQYNGYFKSDMLSKIFHTDSVLIVPSMWNETFSLITLEALSFGIPTLVSTTVGAKDIVSQYDAWFVFRDKAELKHKLKTLLSDRRRLQDYNKSIVNIKWRHSIKDHHKDIIDLDNKTK